MQGDGWIRDDGNDRIGVDWGHGPDFGLYIKHVEVYADGFSTWWGTAPTQGTGIGWDPSSTQAVFGADNYINIWYNDPSNGITQLHFTLPDRRPVANAGGPYTGYEGYSISLSGHGSYDPDGWLVTYRWDLDNDGYYDDATGPTTSHTWMHQGTYNIRLWVTDNQGLRWITQTPLI